MFMLGTGVLSIFASSSQDAKLVIYKILSYDGSLILGSEIKINALSSVSSYIQNMESQFDWRVTTMFLNQNYEYFIGITKTDNQFVGLLKFSNLFNSNDAQLINQDRLTLNSQGYITALQGHESKTDQFFGVITKIKTIGPYEVITQICSFSSTTGINYWCLKFKQFLSNLNSYYQGNQLLSLGGSGSSLLLIMNIEGSSPTPGYINLVLMTGLVDINPQTRYSAQGQFQVGLSTGIYNVNQVFYFPSIANNYAYILVKDLSRQGGTQSIIKLYFGTFTGIFYWDSYDFQMSQGLSFQIYKITSNSASNINDFYFAGQTKYATDGSINQTFSYQQGFIMKSITNNINQVCLQFPNGLIIDLTSPCTSLMLQTNQINYIDQDDIFQIQKKFSVNVPDTTYTNLKQQSTASTPKQTWCTQSPWLKIISASLPQQIYYNSGDPEVKQIFNPPFQINDTTCDFFYFKFSINSTSLRSSDNNIEYNITNFPLVLNNTISQTQYISVSTNNYQDSPYTINFTITVFTPDYRTSISVSSIIIINPIVPKSFITPYGSFVYYKQSEIDTSQVVELPLSYYYMIGTSSVSFTSFEVFGQNGNKIPQVTNAQIQNLFVSFNLNKTNELPITNLYFSIQPNYTSKYLISQTIGIQIISCGSDQISMSTIKPSWNESQSFSYQLKDDYYRLIISQRLDQVQNYSAIIQERFTSVLSSQCPIKGFNIAKVMIKSSGDQLTQKNWEQIFQLEYESGTFTFLKINKTLINYLIYINAENCYGIKGGDDQYLIDLTLFSDPKFQKQIEDIISYVFLGSQTQQGMEYFQLPAASSDASIIQIANPELYPFLSVNISTITVNKDLVTQNDIKEQQIIVILSNQQGGFTEYSFKLVIQQILQKNSQLPSQSQSFFQNNILPIISQTYTISDETKSKSLTPAQTNCLAAKIKQIDSFGLMEIEFNQTLKKINISLINETNTMITLQPADDRNLLPNFNISSLDFTWSVTNESSTKLIIQLIFQDPSAISTLIKQDEITISFLDSYIYIISNETNQPLDPNYKQLSSTIKPQQENSFLARTMQDVAKTSTKGLRYIFLIGIIISLISKNDKSTMFLFLRSCTIIVHLLLSRTRFPANANAFLSTLISIVMFDFFDLFQDFDIYAKSGLFDIDGQKNVASLLPDQAKNLGYESFNSVIVLKTIAFIQIFYILKLLFAFVLYVFTKVGAYQKEFQTVFDKVSNKLFFGDILNLQIEFFFESIISGYLNLKSPLFTKPGEIISIILSQFNLINCFIVFPILIMITIFKKDNEESEVIYEPLLLKLRKKNTSTRYYWAIFWIRRLLLFILFVILSETKFSQAQIVLNSLINLFSIIFVILLKPFKIPFWNFIDIFNENMIIIISTHVCFFSDWIDDSKLQYNLGFSMIFFSSLFLLVNSIPIIYNIFNQIYQIYWKYKVKINNQLADKFPNIFSKITKQKTLKELENRLKQLEEEDKIVNKCVQDMFKQINEDKIKINEKEVNVGEQQQQGEQKIVGPRSKDQIIVTFNDMDELIENAKQTRNQIISDQAQREREKFLLEQFDKFLQNFKSKNNTLSVQQLQARRRFPPNTSRQLQQLIKNPKKKTQQLNMSIIEDTNETLNETFHENRTKSQEKDLKIKIQPPPISQVTIKEQAQQNPNGPDQKGISSTDIDKLIKYYREVQAYQLKIQLEPSFIQFIEEHINYRTQQQTNLQKTLSQISQQEKKNELVNIEQQNQKNYSFIKLESGNIINILNVGDLQEDQPQITDNAFSVDQTADGQYELDPYLPINGKDMISYISQNIENSQKFIKFLLSQKDAFMPERFFFDQPFSYNDENKKRVLEIIKNVIKTSDSREIKLMKKSAIRRCGQSYQKECQNIIKNWKIQENTYKNSPLHTQVEMTYQLGQYFKT